MNDINNGRKILVDADACPVKGVITKIAKKYGFAVVFFIDTSHILDDDYAEVVVVEKGRDSVDFVLINRACRGDIVVTQDYGLAAMTFSKGAYAIHPAGFVYTKDNLDRLLFERHINAKIRRAGGRHSGPPKRRQSDDDNFERALERLCAGVQE